MTANAALRQLIRAARDLDPSQTEEIALLLGKSQVPALVLWGEHDEYLPMERVRRPLAELLRAPFQVLPGGHFTPLDCPAEVASALISLLSGLGADPRG